ncbi:MAG: tetratricopeptide repeat protein, partial [Rhodothermaceae bacterium]|nr:tetratricopeptide repeat protein [Rhodothermaceae bacterium]
GPDHPYVALTLGGLGSVRQRAGDEAGAIAYYRRALALQRRVLPPDHPEIATMLNKLGQALANTKAYDEAERTLREGLAVRRATLDEDHPGVLSDRSALASILAGVGRHNEAIAIHRDILNRRLRTQGEDSPVAARSYYNLSAALRLKNTPESLAEARTVATDMVARYRVMFPAESREVGFALLEHADVLRASGASAEARPLYQEARQIFARGLGPDHPATQRVERALAAL